MDRIREPGKAVRLAAEMWLLRARQYPCGDPLTRTLAESMCASSQTWGVIRQGVPS